MYIPRSHLLNPLLSLLALTPSIAATPTPQSSDGVIDPIPTPDFSRCFFLTIIDTSIEGPFTLTLLSDTLPLQEWPVFLDSNSLYINRIIRLAPPDFTLKDGFLNSTSNLGTSYPGRFVPSTTLSPLQQLVFDGQGEPSDFYAIPNCDATGTPYTELKAGLRELVVEDFVENAHVYGKNPEDIYLGKSQTIHLRINSRETSS